jgi:hypothetical protein
MNIRNSIVTAAIVLCGVVGTRAQSDTTATRYYVHEPWPLPSGQSAWMIGATMTVLPQPLVENEIPAPAFDMRARYGLPENFALVGRLNTNIINNMLSLGGQWVYTIGRFSVAVGDAFTGFYGRLDQASFNANTGMALATVPFVRLGYHGPDFSFSITGDAMYVITAKTTIDDIENTTVRQPWNSGGLTFAVEQPFFNTSEITLGMNLSWSRNPWQTWLLYNTFDEFMMYPEFFVGFAL